MVRRPRRRFGRRRRLAVSWNRQGPKGDAGPQGPKGDPGPSGVSQARAAIGSADDVGGGKTVVSKFATAGSWTAFVSVSTNDLNVYFDNGNHQDIVDCFLRAPGRVVSRATVSLNSIDLKESRPTISLVGAFHLTGDATPDVFCSSTLGGRLTADLVLMKVDSIA